MSNEINFTRGSKGCFTGDTNVLTAKGTVHISTLKEGDEVLSFDDVGKVHIAKVLKLHVHDDNPVNRYHFWGGEYIDATPNHWVLNQYNAFVEIGQLGFDDCLVDENNHLRPITGIDKLESCTVYNLTVENQHTFIANGIRVHNAGLGDGNISGSKGGKGGGRAPIEADDSLFSTATAKIVDLISEGEIVGLLGTGGFNGSVGINTYDSHIYLDETPLINADGTSNFDNVQYATRVGTNSQTYIPGFPGTVTQSGVNLEVKKLSPGPIIKTFSSTVADAVTVLLFTPSLMDGDNEEGDVNGTTLSFKIWIEKDNNGSWVEAVNDSFSGKTTTRYERGYRIEIPSSWKSSGFTTISIKVERITADSSTVKISNKLFWSAYSIVIDNKLRYPNSALIGMTFNAEQFSSIPNRGYEIKGVKVKVPSNYTSYDPGHCSAATIRRQDRCTAGGYDWAGTSVGDTLYSGSWDGTFTTAWTCNPAWILYDLCSEERYGLGKWLDANSMDKWALYEIGRYCDAVDTSGNFVGVDDGWGGKEARFACNLYLQGQHEAFKVLNDIASAFRGMLYWQSGQVTGIQDSPKEPVMLFSDSNVEGGAFIYEGTSKKKRHNVAYVTWNNPEDFYRPNVEYVEDTVGIVEAGNQIFSTDVKAVGCTSQGQANRLGRWILYTERYETETVAFTTGMEGAAIRPGDLIQIADGHRAGVRYGGRIGTGSTTTTIKLDAATSVTSGKSYKLSVINTEEACVYGNVKQAQTTKADCINANPDNEWKPYIWVESRDLPTVTTTESVTEFVLVSANAFTNTPATGQMWVLEEIGTVEAADFRVLSVKETEPNTVGVSALRYHGAKYGYIEDNLAFSSKSISNIPDPGDAIPEPTGLEITEELYVDSMRNIKNRATFSWDAPNTAGTSTTYPYVASYYVEWRRKAPALTNWTSMGETSAQSITIDDAPAGTLEFRVKTRRIF